MDDKDLRYISDYIAIRQLNARYNRFADNGDGESYAEIYTEDAVFTVVGEGAYSGKEQIAERCRATTTAVHVTTEPEISISGDTATQCVRMLSIYRDKEGKRNTFVASGHYTDELKRVDGHWRFYRRSAELDLDINEVLAKIEGKT